MACLAGLLLMANPERADRMSAKYKSGHCDLASNRLHRSRDLPVPLAKGSQSAAPVIAASASSECARVADTEFEANKSTTFRRSLCGTREETAHCTNSYLQVHMQSHCRRSAMARDNLLSGGNASASYGNVRLWSMIAKRIQNKPSSASLRGLDRQYRSTT